MVESLGLLFITLLWGKSLLGLPQNLPRKELLDLYFEKHRPLFPEDEDLKKRILALLEQEENIEEEIRARLKEVLTEDSYGAERGIWLLRECGKTFLPELLDFYERAVREDYENPKYIEDALKPWIKEEEVRRRLLEIAEKYKDYFVFFLLAHYPTTKAALYLAEHFERLLEEDFENLAWLTSLLPHPEVWKKTKKWIHPRVREWKETFVLLAHLFEPEFPGLKDLEEEVLKEEEQFLPLKNESPPALPGEVTLLCKECGYYFPFKPRVVLLVDEDMEPDLTEKVVCPKCGAEESFILPENEKRRLQMQFMLLVHKKRKNTWRMGRRDSNSQGALGKHQRKTPNL